MLSIATFQGARPQTGEASIPISGWDNDQITHNPEILKTCSQEKLSLLGSEEERLIQALQHGDEQAFATLIDTYSSSLLRLAKTFVGSQAVAEEVVQETWMGTLESIKRFEGRSSLKTWLFRILSNRAKTRGQQERRYCGLEDVVSHGHDQEEIGNVDDVAQFLLASRDTSAWLAYGQEEPTPERHLLSKEGVAQIERAIRGLPSLQQQVIMLRDVEGVPSLEVCALLGVSISNQRVLLHRARIKVRKSLAPYFSCDVEVEQVAC